ncbi:MAG: hypothetical protein HC821_01145 [Lewinella sp.]|nr:hypothetical protein [Lewinella sp.]
MGSTTTTPINYRWERLVVGRDSTVVGNALPLTIDSAGRYRLVVTNPVNGCSNFDELLVQDRRSLPPLALLGAYPLSCDGGPALIDAGPAQPGFTYTWTDGSGNPVSASAAFSTSTLGDYTIRVVNTASGCESSQTIAVVANQGAPTVSLPSTIALNCSSDTLLLEPEVSGVSGTETYLWTTPDGRITFGDRELRQARVVGQGTYILTVDNGGCAATDTLTVVAPILPEANLGADRNLDCALALLLSTSGPAPANPAYRWFQGGTLIEGQNMPSLSVSEPATYVLEVTNQDNGCVSQDTIVLGIPLNFPVFDLDDTIRGLGCNDTLVVNPGLTAGGSNILLSISGPGNPRVNPDDTTTVQVFRPGFYLLSATTGGCTAQQRFFVDSSLIVNPFAFFTGPSLVLDCENPQIWLDASGSSTGSNISFTWSSFAGGETPADQGNDSLLVASGGSYRVLVTNTDNGCTASDTIVVNDIRMFPVVDTLPYIGLTCENRSATLAISVADTAGLSIRWFGPGQLDPIARDTLAINVTSGGGYTVVVINNLSSCVTQRSFTVMDEELDLAEIVFAAVGAFDCSTQSLTVDASASLENTAGFNINWQSLDPGNQVLPDSGSLIVSVNGAGSYVLTLSASGGCSISDTLVIQAARNTPVASAGEDFNIECGEMPVLDGSASTPMASDTLPILGQP